jgi:hypothetical protein
LYVCLQIHIVHFDAEHKISQVRLYWDQGALLKLVDVIGARARNWPIRDGKDQARLIATSAASASSTNPQSAASSRRSTTTTADRVTINDRPASSSSRVSNAMNDPHATLSLFQPRDINQETASPRAPSVPRAQSAKPPPRDLNELFVGEEASAGNANPTESPQKIPAKAGAGKNFRPNRLFDESQDEPTAPTPMSIKTHAKKYDHFEFDDGEGDDATPKVRETARSTTRGKHQSQWDFEDFVTPDKVRTKILPNQTRHFGWSDDEVGTPLLYSCTSHPLTLQSRQAETSPVRRPVVHKPRPEQQPHFEFKDDGTPIAQQRKEQTAKGRMHNKGLGLYKDHVLSVEDDDDDDAFKGDVKRSLTHNTNNEGRKKDFDPHWEMKDYSPNPQKTSFNGNGNNKPLPADKQKVLKGLDANWAMYDQSPGQPKSGYKINIAGNGMGGRKGTEAHWTLGGDEEELPASTKPKGNQTNARQQENEPPSQPKKETSEYKINIAGNGMGGRKGTESHWSIGDDEEELPVRTKEKSGTANARQTGEKNFWDF